MAEARGGAIRWIAIGLVLVPLLLWAIGVGRDGRGERLFPDLARAGDVHRIEMARGRQQVVLARRPDTGQWAVLSAADAPADAARVERLIAALAGLRGEPLSVEGPPQTEPLQLRVSAADGTVLGHAAILPGEARMLPDGPRLAIGRLPALPLWQSAWARVEVPRIEAAEIVGVTRGGLPAGPDALAAARELMAGLTPQGFVAAGGVNWAGATALQLQLADGGVVDIQQVADGETAYLVRLTADRRPDVRAARVFAFRTTVPLP